MTEVFVNIDADGESILPPEPNTRQVVLKAEIAGTKNYKRQTHVALKAVIAGTKNCKKKMEVALRIMGTKHQ